MGAVTHATMSSLVTTRLPLLQDTALEGGEIHDTPNRSPPDCQSQVKVDIEWEL